MLRFIDGSVHMNVLLFRFMAFGDISKALAGRAPSILLSVLMMKTTEGSLKVKKWTD